VVKTKVKAVPELSILKLCQILARKKSEAFAGVVYRRGLYQTTQNFENCHEIIALSVSASRSTEIPNEPQGEVEV